MAAYHRLDLDLSHTKKKRWGEVVNSFSVYNAYNRKNPYFIYLGRAAGSNQTELPAGVAVSHSALVQQNVPVLTN